MNKIPCRLNNDQLPLAELYKPTKRKRLSIREAILAARRRRRRQGILDAIPEIRDVLHNL